MCRSHHAASMHTQHDLHNTVTCTTALHNTVMVLSSTSYDADLAATSNMQQVVVADDAISYSAARTVSIVPSRRITV